MNDKIFIAKISIVLFIGFISISSLSACAHMQKETNSQSSIQKTQPTENNGIDFTLPDQNDDVVSLKSLRGKIVLISFWATWCNPCKEEIPILSDMQERYQNSGVTILSVNVDTPDMTSDARSYVATLPTNLTYLFDPDSSSTGFLNPSHDLPFVVLIDRDGNIVWKHHGFAPGDEEEMEQQINKLLHKNNK